ncbi:MAG: CapA family protein, partial [Clostridia bacterium]
MFNDQIEQDIKGAICQEHYNIRRKISSTGKRIFSPIFHRGQTMTTISFTGDIAFSKYFTEAWKDPAFIHKDVVKFLQGSDYVVANVESPFTGGGIEIDSSLTHASNPKAVNCLNMIHANLWTMANNHILDCGDAGLSDTIKLAGENNCRTFGAGMNKAEAAQPVIINEAGGIGMFGVTYKVEDFIEAGENSPGCIMLEDSETIQATIKKIKEKNRWCILIVHAGEEFSSIPLPSIRKR